MGPCVLYNAHLSLLDDVIWVASGEASTLQQVHDITLTGGREERKETIIRSQVMPTHVC